MGSLPPGWEEFNDNTCIKNDERIRDAYEAAVQDNFAFWLIEQQQPMVGLGIVASGYKCRAEYNDATGLVERDRSDLMSVFTESNFKMPNNHTCSTLRCDTCRPYNQPGELPPYLDPVDFTEMHPQPESMMNRRITFPDASGTVITSGCVCTCCLVSHAPWRRVLLCCRLASVNSTCEGILDPKTTWWSAATSTMLSFRR